MKPQLVLAFCLALSGCGVVGPDYRTPEVALETRFAFAGGDALRDAAQDEWWTALGDHVLNRYMHEGLESNLDIQTALARIDQSAAVARGAGVLQSQVSGTLQGSETRVFSDGNTATESATTLNGRFVFDLFGRATRSREQAAANLESTIYSAAQTRLAYQAELADAVIQARFFQAAARATERTVRNRRQILANTLELVESGQATRNDDARARARLAQAQANLPGFEQGLRNSAVRISVLLNRPTAQVLNELRHSGSQQPMPHRRFLAGQPADLLRNRPDVLAAERTLAASYAALGVAYADLYPSLSVDGTIRVDGTESLAIGPTLSVPVLSRWSLLAQREAAQARAQEAELVWRGSIRDAVADVERALIQIQASEEETAALERASANFRELFSLSQETFRIGETTLLELLDAEQEIENAEVSLAAARRNLATGVAQLAVATGRGSAIGAPSRPGDDGEDDDTLVMAEAPEAEASPAE